MGKPRDTKIAILPSTTRKGTTLSTSAALDSPSVISKLVSPPQASNAGTSAESENSSHNCDDASAVLDNDGSLGSFLDATIAKSRQIENTETPNENAATPVNSPESVEYSSDDLDEDYVELDDDFIEKCNATTDARKIKKLLAEHAVRYKLSPDPKFATSPINIRDKDYDFSLDLSHIAIVEKTPFCGTEKESVVEHMTELSTLSGLFSDDIKMRTYFVTKFFPFSLKDDAKTWYNNLPPGSIKSPKELLDVFFRKYFPASAQHAALQRIYNFDQEDGEKLPEAWARFCSLIRAQPDHDLEKHDLLDIFYSGLTIESRAYLDSCAGCVFRKRTPDDAEELLAKIGRNHDDWSTPEPTPTPIVKKRGMIKLNDEDMREAKKSLKEKGIKPEDVKNLPPIEDLCEITPPSSMIESSPELLELRARVRRSPRKLCVDWSLPERRHFTRLFLVDHHFSEHLARDLQRPDGNKWMWYEIETLEYDQEKMMDPLIPTEPFLQTQVYDLANGGDLIFERDLFALTDFLGRTPPVFYGGQISDNGQLQWLIMANLPGKPESPMFRQIQFSLRENTWVDGLAHALQESLARLCGQNSLAIEGERFAHFARHSSVGLPLSLPYHPVLRHHVDHLDYMLYETRSALSDSRSAANHTQQQLNQYADTIKVIAKERRTLRQLVAKRDATIHRLKTKIAVLKETISTQVEQLQILEGEGEGEDIQGDGYSYVSNDNDYEPEEEGDDDFHQHLPAGMDTTFPLRIDG
ncbi:hypothetical protein QYE76_011231 [Lolium multiflorum]|uniref:Retrotransposon gag domain-containing protein n=1 Tax=Lolium multiflorum TaxID=4521 RepID=A0AAD8X5F3_LOLMU|nr:hypothetical protein QYE76_011231 [Lolium multiflorum]